MCPTQMGSVLIAVETVELSSVCSSRGDRHAHNNRRENELVYKTEIESQTQKSNLQLQGQGSELLLLSHFSCVQLCVTPSLGFSRQEHWSGLPFPSPMHESEK